MLGIFIYRALEPVKKELRLSWRRILLTCLMTISYGIIDEVHQSFVPGRYIDRYDMFADAIGAITSVILMTFLTARRIRNQSLITK